MELQPITQPFGFLGRKNRGKMGGKIGVGSVPRPEKSALVHFSLALEIGGR